MYTTIYIYTLYSLIKSNNAWRFANIRENYGQAADNLE